MDFDYSPRTRELQTRLLPRSAILLSLKEGLT